MAQGQHGQLRGKSNLHIRQRQIRSHGRGLRIDKIKPYTCRTVAASQFHRIIDPGMPASKIGGVDLSIKLSFPMLDIGKAVATEYATYIESGSQRRRRQCRHAKAMASHQRLFELQVEMIERERRRLTHFVGPRYLSIADNHGMLVEYPGG